MHHLEAALREERALRRALGAALNAAAGPSAATLVQIRVASRDRELRFLFELLARCCGFRCAVAWRCVSRDWLRIVDAAYPATALLSQVIVTGGWDGSACVFDSCFAASPFGSAAATVDDRGSAESGAAVAPRVPATWEALPSLNIGRWGHSTLLTSGGVVVLGGAPLNDEPLASVEQLAPSCAGSGGGGWRMLPSMSTGRIRFSAAVLRGGFIVVAGGWAEKRYYRSAELFDPRTRTWSALPPMAHERSATGTAVLDGQLVVVGGWDGKKALDSVEVLTLPLDDAGVASSDGARASGGAAAGGAAHRGARWTTLPPMRAKRWGCAAVACNGRLIVAGGKDKDPGVPGAHALDTVEQYDPATQEWSALPAMCAHREALGATEVCGRVVVVGGRCDGCALKCVKPEAGGASGAAVRLPPCSPRLPLRVPTVEVLTPPVPESAAPWRWSSDLLSDLPSALGRVYGAGCMN